MKGKRIVLSTPSVVATGGASGISLNVSYPSKALGGVKLAFIGSSTFAGTGASIPANNAVSKIVAGLQAIFKTVTYTNLGTGGYTSYHLLPTGSSNGSRPAVDPAKNITAALATSPDIILVHLPGNDASFGYSSAEYIANLTTICNTGLAAGVKMFMLSTSPKSQSYGQQVKDQFPMVMNAFGQYAIDVYTALNGTGYNINPIYDAGDGVHLNDAGHQLFADLVVPSVQAYIASTHQVRNFVIERSTSSGTGFTTLTTLSEYQYSYEDTTTTAGITNYYRVTATRGTISSSVSTESSASKGSVFNPLTLPGLQLLIDADNIAGADGATVANITEASANAYVLTSAGSPTIVYNQLNGRKVLRYNNNKHSMPAGSFGMFRNKAGGTIYAVSKRNLTSTHWTFRMYTSAVGTNTRFGIGSSANNFEGVGGRRLPADSFSEAKNSTGTSQTWKIESGTVDFVNRLINYNLNGTLNNSNNAPFYTAGNTDDLDGVGGAVMDNAIGDLAYLAVCNQVHDQATIDQMEAYLNSLFSLY
jgi:lysophospholipase L1-like esterase